VDDQPLVISDADLLSPPDGQFWVHDEDFGTVPADLHKKGDCKTEKVWPNYSVQEVSKFFFGKNSDWLRWRYESDERVSKKTGMVTTPARHPQGFFVLDGVPLEPKRDSRAGYRYYTLADVERMAHALAQNGALDGYELLHTLRMVKLSADMWRKRARDRD